MKKKTWIKAMIFFTMVAILCSFPLFGQGSGEAADAAAGKGSGEIIEYGLKGGKPYTGTTLTVMLNNAAKNNAIEARLGEFEELTGIKVEADMTPFGSLLEKIYFRHFNSD